MKRAWLLPLLIFLSFPLQRGAAREKVDIVVYGGTPGGIAATLSAGKCGRRVLLVEPTPRLGGMVTNGLSHADFRTFEGLTGTYLQFSQRVQKDYADRYGPKSPQAQGCFRGTHAEPHVNLLVFEKMLAAYPTVRILRNHRLTRVHTKPASPGKESEPFRVESAVFTSDKGKQIQVKADVFIDGTYEGDLLALAGVKYRVGREARKEYGESLAPEKADRQVQGYNFRLIMTRDPANRVMPTAPVGYNRKEFLAVVPLLKSGRIKTVFCRSTGGIYKAQQPSLPNGKHDINDVSRGLARLSLPDVNDAWPEGNHKVRERIFQEHVRHNVGLLYFLQNDKEVPDAFRKEARMWGWCKDEFQKTGHIPGQLYVREARRMLGMRIFTQRDTEHAVRKQGGNRDARAVLHTDAIAMGDYGPNCHGTAHKGPRFGGRHTGEFYKRVPPYQIPYGTLVPRRCTNLLVPVACSASHVGFCALRLEPIWMSLGQAAGFAGHVALKDGVAVQGVRVSRVQQFLHADGAATIYVSDVLPGHGDFAAVQWWGTHGGLHGLAPQPREPGQRGAHLRGQYYRAFPGHAVELKKVLDEQTRERWEKLARSLGVDTRELGKARTRGAFIRSAYTAALSKRTGRGDKGASIHHHAPQ